MSLSETSKMYLAKAGWDSSRRVDISLYVEGLQAEGYEVSSCAREFLTQFGGLELLQPAFRVKNKLDKLHFKPLIASTDIFREKVQSYEERVYEPLVVVGEAYNGYLTLMISETGKVYGGYDSFLTFLGSDYTEALDSLFLCRKTPEIK